MKSLFVSYIAPKTLTFGNTIIEIDKIANHEDLDSLIKYIEMKTGEKNIVITNFRRME